MAGVDLNSVINLIMQNPELLASIKKLAPESEEESSAAIPEKAEENPKSDIPKPDEKARSVEAQISPKESRPRGSKGKRSELLHALSPYISEGRQKALESFMTIADILELMREK